MKIDDLILVSVDDHVVEPPDMWEGRLPARWKDRAPRLVHKADGTDVWVFEGQQIPNIGLNAVAGRPPEEYGMEPTSLAQLREGNYDIHRRIDDMNAAGILGSMCFASMTGFCGELFGRQPDKELARVMIQAYNDWHIDTWCGTYPGRFIPLALPMLWDPKLMADEIRRVARKGCHAMCFADNPTGLGYPSLHNDYWEPVWKAASEEGTVIAIHIGSGTGMKLQDVAGAGRDHDHVVADQPVRLRRGARVLEVPAPVPGPQDRALRGRDRLGAVLPRARRLRLRAPPLLDAPGLRRPAGRATCSASTSSRASSTTRAA